MMRFRGAIARAAARVAREATSARANTRRGVSFKRQLEGWRRGFYAEHLSFYDVDRYGFEAYVSDWERYAKFPALSAHPYLLDDKLVFAQYMQFFGLPTPNLLGFIHRDRVVMLDDTGIVNVEDAVARHGRIVIKPRNGSKGEGFIRAEMTPSGITFNGESVLDVRRAIPKGNMIITEFVEQHEYARQVNPLATNSMRILTLWNDDEDEPFLAFGTQRFGTSTSGTVDNFSKGGVAARIDITTGVIGRAVAKAPLAKDGRITWHTHHPDTGAPIEGLRIPGWPEVVQEVERIAARFPGLPLVGWDIAVTPDGISVIEGNKRPEVNHFQRHAPLLIDPRIRRFFEIKGVRLPLETANGIR